MNGSVAYPSDGRGVVLLTGSAGADASDAVRVPVDAAAPPDRYELDGRSCRTTEQFLALCRDVLGFAPFLGFVFQSLYEGFIFIDDDRRAAHATYGGTIIQVRNAEALLAEEPEAARVLLFSVIESVSDDLMRDGGPYFYSHHGPLLFAVVLHFSGESELRSARVDLAEARRSLRR